MQELTDEEQRVRRDGLRILAQLIARHHLTLTEAAAGPGDQEVDQNATRTQRGTAS